MYFHHVMLYLLQNETVHSPNRFEICKYETLFAIRYHLHNLENMNNTHGDVLLLVSHWQNLVLNLSFGFTTIPNTSFTMIF